MISDALLSKRHNSLCFSLLHFSTGPIHDSQFLGSFVGDNVINNTCNREMKTQTRQMIDTQCDLFIDNDIPFFWLSLELQNLENE